MLILLTEGELAWDNEASDFEYNETTARQEQPLLAV